MSNWQKLDYGRTHATNALRLNKANMHIGRGAYADIGSPERINIEYDVEAKAIRLSADPDGRKVSPSSTHLSLTLSRHMPVGKYFYRGEGVFVHESLNTNEGGRKE